MVVVKLRKADREAHAHPRLLLDVLYIARLFIELAAGESWNYVSLSCLVLTHSENLSYPDENPG